MTSTSTSAAGPVSAAASSSSNGQLFYQKSLQEAANALDKARQTKPHPTQLRIPRVTQLDAGLLDTELESLLKDPLVSALQTVRSPDKRSLDPEIAAVLRFILLRLSLKQWSASYGARMQNLVYRNEFAHIEAAMTNDMTETTAKLFPPSSPAPTESQINSYIALSILPEYVHSRLREYMLSQGWPDYPKPRSLFSLNLISRDPRKRANAKREWKRVLWETVNLSERFYAVAKLVNLLVFLYNGQYRTVLDRVLGLRLVHANSSAFRNVNFEFLSRQLVWESFTEFLLVIMPLINVRKSKLWLWRQAKKVLPSLDSSSDGQLTSASDSPANGPLQDLPHTICAICYSDSLSLNRNNVDPDPDPTDPLFGTTRNLGPRLDSTDAGSTSTEDCELKLPYTVNCCNAKYCYYCITSRMHNSKEDEDSNWTCLRCAQKVTTITRWKGGGRESDLPIE